MSVRVGTDGFGRIGRNYLRCRPPDSMRADCRGKC